MTLHQPITDPLSVPPITVRCVEPTEGLVEAYQSDDPDEFYRLLEAKYPNWSDEQ